MNTYRKLVAVIALALALGACGESCDSFYVYDADTLAQAVADGYSCIPEFGENRMFCTTCLFGEP